ncbi:SAM-dependent methyltransferase [Paucihalobacter ruber]|uniref:SAM-dependent methyltransferase n=1 Tax=Paucihalobacter ruber TaxID=2567861 RepID=A0A506PIQ6_9FLAO|nr:SAM-dependent methyltransferase [Paucihalobacter ruber]TPV32270.1 SAM-dependent methyltransferase [Paucihalobacter ruber]
MKKGKLYLIPTTLGDNAPFEVLPITVKKAIEDIDHYIVETEKVARRFIKNIYPGKSQPKLTIYHLNKFTNTEEMIHYLDVCDQGISVGLLSDAGCPAIADPGADIVKLAHDKGIEVIPLVGPSSILLSMMASGMNGQGFSFNGYLPIDKQDRKQKIKQLEKLSKELNMSQSFIETPYRNNQIFEELLKTLHHDTRLCVACDITLNTQFIKTTTAAKWSKIKVDLHKRPTIFIIHKD